MSVQSGKTDGPPASSIRLPRLLTGGDTHTHEHTWNFNQPAARDHTQAFHGVGRVIRLQAMGTSPPGVGYDGETEVGFYFNKPAAVMLIG